LKPLVKRDLFEYGNLRAMHPKLQHGIQSGEAPEQQTPVPSPCIKVCQIAPETGLCRGCLRTLDEIARWSRASEDDKRAVWAEIRRREAQLFP
jgi:hypothetical protein